MDQPKVRVRINKLAPYPKNCAKLSGREILEFRYAVGKVVYTRHGGQVFKAVNAELTSQTTRVRRTYYQAYPTLL